MEERWGFLASWCKVLKEIIWYKDMEFEEDVWNIRRRSLEVHLPSRREGLAEDEDYEFDDETEGAFQTKFQHAKEALALLAAVAHVDHAGWRYLLQEHCKVAIGQEGMEEFELEVPAKFELDMDLARNLNAEDHTFDSDLIQMCGVRQHCNPSQEYVEALEKISRLDETLQPNQPGVDITILVHVNFGSKNVDKPVEVFTDIWRSLNVIKAEWERELRTRKPVACGSLRCTFGLNPMIADFRHSMLTPEISGVMDRLLRHNVMFSILSLCLCLDEEIVEDEQCWREIFSRLVTRVFNCSRRRLDIVPTKYYGELDSSAREGDPLQLRILGFESLGLMEPCDVESMCSAMVLNQNTSKLLMPLDRYHNTAASRHTWKWLAYALFSKRARSMSSLESLVLNRVCSMTTTDMEVFAAILAAKHPEEVLFDCPRGRIADRDATVVTGAPLVWEFDSRGQPVLSSKTLTSDATIPFVRTFSDDGKSKWVNALVPGYGRCLVQRDFLVFDQADTMDVRADGSISLMLEFHKHSPSVSDGLPLFLAAVGPSLKSLTLDGPRMDLDVNVILQSCPKLRQMALCGGPTSDLRLDFSEYQDCGQSLPAGSIHMQDIGLLARDLSDTNNPLSKCVCRLRVRVKEKEDRAEQGTASQFSCENQLNGLLKLLETNRVMEYMEILAPKTLYEKHFDSFRKLHHDPIGRTLAPLSLECKAAFLSVVSFSPPSATSSTKKKRASLSRGPDLRELDRFVVANVFAYAATPALRKVFFRRCQGGFWNRRDELPI